QFEDRFSRIISQVHWTSALVKGLPSCHLTPSRSFIVSTLLSALHDHAVARSGLIDSGRAISSCWSYMTRLLNTGMKGVTALMVPSSRSDALGGASARGMRSVPPAFCATA